MSLRWQWAVLALVAALPEGAKAAGSGADYSPLLPSAALSLGMQVTDGEAAMLAVQWAGYPIMARFSVETKADPNCLQDTPAKGPAKCPVVMMTLEFSSRAEENAQGVFASLQPEASPNRGDGQSLSLSLGPYGDGGETDLQAGFYSLLPALKSGQPAPPVLVVSTYTGGAHCCDRVRLFYHDAPAAQDGLNESDSTPHEKGRWHSLELGEQNGGGLLPVITAPHVAPALVQEDGRFDYTFDSHAGSFMPPLLTGVRLSAPDLAGAQHLETYDLTRAPAYRGYLLHDLAQSAHFLTGGSAEADNAIYAKAPGFLAYAMAMRANLAATGGTADRAALNKAWKAVLQAPVEEGIFGVSPCGLLPQKDQDTCTPEQKKTLPFPQGLRAFLVATDYLTPAQAKNFPDTLAAFAAVEKQEQAQTALESTASPTKAKASPAQAKDSAVGQETISAQLVQFLQAFKKWWASLF